MKKISLKVLLLVASLVLAPTSMKAQEETADSVSNDGLATDVFASLIIAEPSNDI